MIVVRDVLVHRRRLAAGRDKDVDPAVVVVVRAHGPAPLAVVGDPRRERALRETAVAVGHEKARRVVGIAFVDARVAIGVEQVQVAVVVEVREAASPAPVAVAHVGLVGSVLEVPEPIHVPIEAIAENSPKNPGLSSNGSARIATLSLMSTKTPRPLFCHRYSVSTSPTAATPSQCEKKRSKSPSRSISAAAMENVDRVWWMFDCSVASTNRPAPSFRKTSTVRC